MKDQWYLTEYNVKESPNGKLLLNAVNALAEKYPYNHCIISRFDGGLETEGEDHDLIDCLLERDSQGTPHAFALKASKRVFRKLLVIDWGDFYFFNGPPEIDTKLFTSFGYEKIISQTAFTIRVVDSEILQFFTKDSIRDIKFGCMELSFIKNGILESFDYPG